MDIDMDIDMDIWIWIWIWTWRGGPLYPTYKSAPLFALQFAPLLRTLRPNAPLKKNKKFLEFVNMRCV